MTLWWGRLGAALALCSLSFSAFASVTTTFRDGESPSATYAGTRDVMVHSDDDDLWDPNKTYDWDYLNCDGSPTDEGILIKWVLPPPPVAGATITGVSLVVYVINGTGDIYDVYDVKQPWVESQVNWYRYSSTGTWATPGAQAAPTDHGSLSLGTMPTGTATDVFVTIPLSGAVSVVQGWQTNPATNNGLLIQRYASGDGFAFRSSEYATIAQRPALQLTYSNGSVVTLREGENGYTGTTDAVIANGPPYNFNASGLELDGQHTPYSISTLVAWDVSAIPAWSTVTAANIVLYTPGNASVDTFSIYESLRPWSEAALNWLTYDGTNAWAVAGGDSTTDHGATVLGTVAPTVVGSKTYPLNPSGVQLVQSWVRRTKTNNGFHILDYTKQDGADFADRESATIANRPGLVVTYVEGKLVFNSATPSAGTGSATGAITLQRQRIDGAPIDIGAPDLVVTLRSSSAFGQFATSPDAYAAWGSTLSVTIPAGQSTSPAIYYRDGLTGAPALTASAGAAWNDGTQAASILPFIFADDVETGSLITPAGRWTEQRLITGVPNTLTASTAASHRGSYGIRHVDTDGTSGVNGGQNALAFVTSRITGDYHARAWVRLISSNNAGSASILILGGASAGTMMQVTAQFPGGNLSVGGYNSSSVWGVDSTTSSVFGVGAWHLVEFSAFGFDTTAGVRKVWVDGALKSTGTMINWSISSIDYFTLGEPWSDNRAFTGTWDFDDVRASTAPLASHFRLTAPSTPVNVNACVALTVGLRDSVADALADAPYALSGVLSASGVTGGFYSNSTCTTTATSAAFAQGARSATVYFKPTATGTAGLQVTHPDFLQGTASLTVVTGAPLAIAPATPTAAPNGTLTFTASGGSGTGYVWSMATSPSGGRINASTGAYTAGPTPNVADVVRVTDSLGATATVNVTVGPRLAVSPVIISVSTGSQLTFTASGGQSPYTFSLPTSASGGVIIPTTGVYTAGSLAGVSDVVRVTDATGSTASATVSVISAASTRVQLSGPTTFSAGAGAGFNFQVVDGSGMPVGGAKSMDVRLIALTSGDMIDAVITASSLGPAGGTTSSGSTAQGGNASVSVQDFTAERFQLCAALSSDPTTEQCQIITVDAANPDHARAVLLDPPSQSACSEVRIEVSVVDRYGNVPPRPSTVSLCGDAARSASIVSSTLSSESRSGKCVTGDLSATGTAVVTVSDRVREMVTFTPSQAGLLQPATPVTVTWGPAAFSASHTLLETDRPEVPARLMARDHLIARVSPRDACDAPYAVRASDVVVLAPDPLQVGPGTFDAVSNSYRFEVALPACPADATMPLEVTARVGSEVVSDGFGAPVALRIQPVCRPPAFLSTPNGAAECGMPYRYSEAGAPDVSGDGPFEFRATNRDGGPLPRGFALAPSGEIIWVPDAEQTGQHHLSLTVAGAGGTASQPLDITVTCSQRGCGCGSSEGGATLAGLLLLAGVVRWRRLRRRA